MSGEGLFNEFLNIIEKLDLDIDNVRGQRYENGSNMKGKHYDVQKKTIRYSHRAFYTPRGCHNLNLVICEMTNSCVKTISHFLSGTMYIFFIFLFYKKMKSFRKYYNWIDNQILVTNT